MGRMSAFIRNERGAVAIEYALIASIVVFAILAGATLIGANLAKIFTAVGNGF